MRKCELCGAEVSEEVESCSRCGFEFQKEVRADVRDAAILRKHGGKPVTDVNRELKNSQARLAAFLDNMIAKGHSREEIASLLDEALAFLRIPMVMGVEDELRFNDNEKELLKAVTRNIEDADNEYGVPVGTPGTYIRLSNALQALGKPDAAMCMIDKALLINPRDPDAMFAKATLHFRAKRYPAARVCLEKISGSDKASYMLELIDQISPGQ